MSAEATIPVDIFKGQDFYVPAFQVRVENKELHRDVLSDVISVSYSDSLKEIDSFEMVVNNWDAETLKFKYSDAPTFNPWKDAELWLGYYRDGVDERRRMLIGEMTTLTPNFPESGAPTLTARALNLFHRFRTEQKTKPFFGQRDSQIAQTLVADIAADLRKKFPQLTLKIDIGNNLKNEEPIPYLLLNNQYPIIFLMQRARDLGYELTMNEVATGSARVVTFRYGPTDAVKRKTYVLEWGKSLVSFQPTLQVANQVAELTVRGWNPQTKRPIKVSVKRSDVAGIVSPSDLALTESAPNQKQEIVIDRPVSNEAEARQLAINRLKQIGEVIVEGKGKTLGLPDLRAGTKVQIKGLGQRFSGSDAQPNAYVITSTTHSFGANGYTTDFTARMEKS
jgi:phage protein D